VNGDATHRDACDDDGDAARVRGDVRGDAKGVLDPGETAAAAGGDAATG